MAELTGDDLVALGDGDLDIEDLDDEQLETLRRLVIQKATEIMYSRPGVVTMGQHFTVQ